MHYYQDNKVYITEELYYTIYRIKNRVILAPCDELKNKQRYIKRAISWIYPLKLDILKSAQVHQGKKWVLKLDIKDFYGSVPLEHIKWILEKVSNQVRHSDANYYIKMTTVGGKLPTGAITSAHIANACFARLDKFIRQYCRNYEVNYSRYMDDMTFSSDDKFYLNKVEKYVTNLLGEYGYRLNNKKTKYISDNKQQNILGLVVNNGRARLPKNFKRKIRAMLHSYCLPKNQNSSTQLKHRVWGEKKIAELNGYLAYIKCVDFEFYKELWGKYSRIPMLRRDMVRYLFHHYPDQR